MRQLNHKCETCGRIYIALPKKGGAGSRRYLCPDCITAGRAAELDRQRRRQLDLVKYHTLARVRFANKRACYAYRVKRWGALNPPKKGKD